MKYEDFKNKLESIWNEKFPKSKIDVRYSKKLCECIFIRTFLANNENELSYGYYDNDMINDSFMITNFNYEDINELRVFRANCGFLVKPTNDYLCYEYKNIRFTKKNNENVDGFIKKFTKYVDTLYNNIIEFYNNDMIHNNYKKLVEEKIINMR